MLHMEMAPTPLPRVIQSVAGTFHHFDLARELASRGFLTRIYSSFPWRRLRREGVSRELVRTFPWIHTPWMVAGRYGLMPQWASREIAVANARIFDAWVASRVEGCDVFVGLSGSALNSGQVVQGRGGKYICDRGSSHIRYQKRLVEEEYSRWGFGDVRVDPRMVEREENEYAQADAITVPSEFSRRSFLEMGVSAGKLRKIPYGVRLDRFSRTGRPPADPFNVLFAGTVSIRKGVPYLLEAFAKFKHPLKRLRLAGPVEPEMRLLFARFDMTGVEVLGRQPQTELARWMNASHVMVLPSIEDGFGLVMAQAMACGTPIIASEHTGGFDLFTDGTEGFMVPIRSSDAICERLTQLADDPDLRQCMSAAALQQVRGLGGWDSYGAQYAGFLQEITGQSDAHN
jgi:alpha-maltose-1-phosphate synthase